MTKNYKFFFAEKSLYTTTEISLLCSKTGFIRITYLLLIDGIKYF